MPEYQGFILMKISSQISVPDAEFLQGSVIVVLCLIQVFRCGVDEAELPITDAEFDFQR